MLDADINCLQTTQNYKNFSTHVQAKLDEIRSLIVETEKCHEECQHVQAFLDSLKFDSMGLREAQIQDSYKETFEWMLKQDVNIKEGVEPWPSFPQWLQSGQSIYWINGKPGSGKSTVSKNLFFPASVSVLLMACS